MKISSHTLSSPSHAAKCWLTGAVAVALGLAGCGGGSKSVSTTTNASTTTTTTTTTTTPTVPAATTTTTSTPSTTSNPATITVRIEGGRPVGGIQRTTAKKGQQVVLVVHSDVADEVHLHGYDLSKDVGAGGTVRIQFMAKLTGVFEIELENRSLEIAELTVR